MSSVPGDDSTLYRAGHGRPQIFGMTSNNGTKKLASRTVCKFGCCLQAVALILHAKTDREHQIRAESWRVAVPRCLYIMHASERKTVYSQMGEWNARANAMKNANSNIDSEPARATQATQEEPNLKYDMKKNTGMRSQSWWIIVCQISQSFSGGGRRPKYNHAPLGPNERAINK